MYSKVHAGVVCHTISGAIDSPVTLATTVVAYADRSHIRRTVSVCESVSPRTHVNHAVCQRADDELGR